ncbi:MAG: XrtA/PEP-CTERM system exopolysaccharide export protein [Pseudomonadota bacterium]
MHTSKKLVVAATLLVSFALAGCQSAGVNAADVNAQAAAATDEYQIGPGDALQIFVWDHPDLSTAVQVRPDGKISTPLVEDLQAAGRSPTQLARDIEGVLGEYVRSPVVTVIMQSFVGKADQLIRVVGQAVAPQSLQYRQGMTVLDVMIQVGGLSEFAAGNRSKLVRNVNGQRTEIRVRIDDLLNDGDIEQNIRVLPGDVIIIPESFF